jgi:hypothetical protein
VQKSVEARIQRMEDIHELQQLMGRYEYLHTANMHDEVVDLFATTVPVKIEIPTWGVWEGMDAAWRCFHGFHNWLMKEALGAEGAMMQHTLTTPVIEIAGDGNTAKGVWMSPGHEAHTIAGKKTSIWCWGTYGADFINESGSWKLRNLHVYLNIYTLFDRPWTAEEPFRPAGALPPGFPDQWKPDRPNTYDWLYSTRAVTELIPAPPKPHGTYEPTTDYIR